MERGSWSWHDEGEWVVFSLQHPAVTGGLCRAVALGDERSCRLGTLLPEGGTLTLRRRIRRDQLVKFGCYPPQSVEFFLIPAAASIHPPYGYELEPDPVALFHDSLLRQQAGRLNTAFVKPLAPEGFMLAVPYDGTGEFPLLSILCFARFDLLDEMPVVQYAFDGQGIPKLLNSF